MAAPANKDQRLALYRSGLTDTDIAKATGGKRNTITVWRRNNGLPANYDRTLPSLSQEKDSIRSLFYALGWSDRHIARELGLDHMSIRWWRRKRGLAPHYQQGQTEQWKPRPTIADLVTKCRRSVGRYLPRDIAEDTVADILLDVVQGKLAISGIDGAAKKYGNGVVKAFADKWGNRSLDADLGDSDGFTLLDTIADDSASSWLEEMGATVW